MAAPALWSDPQDTVPQRKGITLEDNANATQIYKSLETKERYLQRHHQVRKKSADNAKENWMETLQVCEKYDQ